MEFVNFLQSDSIEEKIVGLVRFQQLLKEKNLCHVEYNYPESLELVVSSVTPQFLVQMLHTNFVGPNFSIQDVAMSIFEMIIDKHPSLLQRFSTFDPQILELVYLENNFNDRLFDIVVAIHGIEESSILSQAMFLKTLEFVCSNSSQNSVIAFRRLIELTCNLNTKLSLSPHHSQQLRDILLQGLRTASRETMRDDFVIATMVFLAHLNPVWTTNHTSSKDGNKFVMVVVSLICGEYRLLLQELLTITTERSEDQSTSQIHEQRFQRSIDLAFVCSEIFDLIFSFLVGDVMDESVPASWQSLSSGALQLIQKEVTQSIELFFNFLRVTVTSSSKETRGDLQTVVTRSMMSFAPWIREDESLHSFFVDSYDHLIQFSSLPTLKYTDPAAQHSIEMKEQILRVLFQSSPHEDQARGRGNFKATISSDSKCMGGVGFVLLLRSISSASSSNSAPGHHLLLLKDTLIDPFLATLDCVLSILSDETVSDRLTSVAICSVPHIHSTLITLLDEIQRYMNREDQAGASDIQQQLLLCSIVSEFLFALLTSSRNQMMESLQIVATSHDPAAGEYLRVSQNGWKQLISRISLLLRGKGKDGAKSCQWSSNEIENYQSLVERLGSLDEIFRNLFRN